MIVVTGSEGQLGTAFRKVVPKNSVFLSRSDLDLTNLDRIGPVVEALKPSIVINCAAYTAVDAAETDEETANAVNAYAVEELAVACRRVGARLVTFSTDYVFDGNAVGGYVESDVANPINAYGRSKRLGERLAVKADPDTLVVRTSWLLSGTHPSFLKTILSLISRGRVSVVDDQFGHPTMVNDLAPAVLEAVELGSTGLLHLANAGVVSWYELACEIASIAGFDVNQVGPCTTLEYPTPAARPKYSMLQSERVGPLGLTPMPDYRGSLVQAVHSLNEL